MNKSESNHTPILVIGAGIAGLTAAKLLHKSGYEVLILEGKNRIGGRTHTIQCGSSALDTGAAWIHFQDGNPLKIIAEANNMEVVKDSYESFYLWDKIKGGFNEEETLELLDIAEDIIDIASDYFLTSTVNPSSAAFLEDYLEHQDWNDNQKRLIRFLYDTLLETSYGADTHDISLSDEKYLHKFNRKEENDAFLVGGYQQLVNLLQKDLTIHLSQIIQKIDYRSDTIHITTTDKKRYTCDKVIVTTSLGVLKSGDLQFVPSLNLAKKTAIAKMGYGNLEKVILTFEERFWHEKGLLFFNEQHDEGLAFPILLDYTTIAGTPTLVIFYAGTYATFIQEKEEAYILENALKALEKMYDKTNLKPTDYFVSRWSKDPLFRGSYSYSNDDNVKNYIRELARPIDNKVFFAGEATSLTGQAYVHGALFSGVREAVRLGASIDGIKGLRTYIENRTPVNPTHS